MNELEILKRIEAVVSDVLDISDLRLERKTTARDVEDWDSLSHINIIVSMEKEFAMKFSLSEIQSLKNVGEMVDLVGRKEMQRSNHVS